MSLTTCLCSLKACHCPASAVSFIACQCTSSCRGIDSFHMPLQPIRRSTSAHASNQQDWSSHGRGRVFPSTCPSASCCGACWALTVCCGSSILTGGGKCSRGRCGLGAGSIGPSPLRSAGACPPFPSRCSGVVAVVSGFVDCGAGRGVIVKPNDDHWVWFAPTACSPPCPPPSWARCAAYCTAAFFERTTCLSVCW